MRSRLTFFQSWLSLGCILNMVCLGTAASQTNLGADFSGYWTRGPAVHADFRPLAAGPGPVMNLTPPAPDQAAGQGSRHQGDYTNPILQPWTAEIVKQRGDADIAGRPVLHPGNVCAPYGLPFILRLGDTVQFLHTRNDFVILYAEEMRARIVYMNTGHPPDLTPSYYGHSVGHWERDVLVIDTVGLNDRTWTDRNGTPHTERMRVVERYHKVDEATVRVDFMVEDPGAFTTPWAAWVSYSPAGDHYYEQVCAENAIDVLTGRELPIPRDDTPDF